MARRGFLLGHPGALIVTLLAGCDLFYRLMLRGPIRRGLGMDRR